MSKKLTNSVNMQQTRSKDYAKMEVIISNNVKIYDLSYGKAIPNLMDDRKRRKLQKNYHGFQLIQDFNMPDVCTGLKMSHDSRYIIVTGLYKPRLRCYDLGNVSMKFERCFDTEAIQIEMLEDDYSKFALLQLNRYIEFHAKFGSYYLTRVPKFGHDMTYHRESCDLYVVGNGSEAYRFNLEQGRFLYPLQTTATSLNKVKINPVHNLISCGTMEGTIESFDPRMRKRIGILDCATSCITDNTIIDGFPSITSLCFKDALTMAVGTFTGQILLYDIRAKKPYTVKDHMYGLPIKNIEFIKNHDMIASLDPKCIKIWNQSTGKPYTSIQAPVHLNELCVVPNTGLILVASEKWRMLSYFIPSLGPAPFWCSNLDNATEELESSRKEDTVYDDYKFVTRKELEEVHFEHLIGTNLLRAYMHGYFMDIRLYNKAKSLTPAIAFSEMKKKMVKSKIEIERREVIVNKLPSVNKLFAEKLMERKVGEGLKGADPYADDRFKEMFNNPDFTINKNDLDYKRVKSIVEKPNAESVKLVLESEQLKAVAEEENPQNYTSSEEEVKTESESEPESEDELDRAAQKKNQITFQSKASNKFSMLSHHLDEDNSHADLPLIDRINGVKRPSEPKKPAISSVIKTSAFASKKQKLDEEEQAKKKAHLRERRQLRRPTKLLR